MDTNVEKIKETEVKNDAEEGGLITVTNKGAFVARARVIYILGEEVVEKTTPDILVLQSAFLSIPDDARNITFNVDIALFFGTWATICWRSFNEVPIKCYELYGTTFSAQCVEVPCDSNDNNPNPIPPVIIPPYNCGCPCRCCCNYCCNPQYYNPYISSYNSLGEGYGYNYY